MAGGAGAAEEPPHSAELDAAIIRQAKRNGVPEKLIRRIVMRESRYNPTARNRSYWGLMQISYPTAKSMGFKGTPQQLLNPFVNLTYAVPYLANAFVIAGKQEDAAVRLYASGYYATAKSRGLLGLLRTAESAPASAGPGEPDVPSVTTVAALPQPAPAPTYGIFGALLGPSEQPRSAEQLVASAPEAAAAQPGTVPLPASAKDSDEVALTIDKTGAMQPPKKWQRDGGVSTIARGEQSVEQVAPHASADAGASVRPKRGHASKVTTFAALDLTPATAQAYAGPADAQDPRYAQSQAAITQATSGPQAESSAPVDTAAVVEPTSDDKPAKKHRVAHKPTKEATAVAKADTAAGSDDTYKTKTRHAKRSSPKKDASSLQADGSTTIDPPPIRQTVQ